MNLKKKKQIRRLSISAGIVIIVIAGIFFIQKALLSSYETMNVIVAKKDIKENTFITEKNKLEYFEQVKVQKGSMLEESISSIDDIDECFIKYPMQKNEQLTRKKALSVGSDVMESFKEAVEVSLKVDNISDAVSGTLRKGNRVDIISVQNDSEPETVLKNVYISGTYNSDGTIIDGASAKKASVVFNFLIEREDYIDFLEGTKNGGVKLVKVS